MVKYGCQPKSKNSDPRSYAIEEVEEEAAKTRRRIVTAAAGEFRKHGIEATGLADLMQAAGLTHGGFYKHFELKRQVVAEACAEAVQVLVERLEAAPSEGLCWVVSLDPPQRQSGHGLPACRARERACPLRQKDTRSGDGRLLEACRRPCGEVRQGTAGGRRERALVAVSTMIGAVTMSRVVTDAKLSADILIEAEKCLGDK